jgi:hypothetical protein
MVDSREIKTKFELAYIFFDTAESKGNNVIFYVNTKGVEIHISWSDLKKVIVGTCGSIADKYPCFSEFKIAFDSLGDN